MRKLLIAVVALLLSCGTARAALLKSFVGSSGKLGPCTVAGHASSKCFKLYCDPQGIVGGRITAFIDVPDIGVPRLDGLREIMMHPAYNGTLENTIVDISGGRQRTESTIFFQAITPLTPPVGPIELFTYETGDNFPALGAAGTFGGFEFQLGDFLTIFDTDTQQTLNFDHTQLQGVTFPIIEVPEPAAGALAAALIGVGPCWRRRRVGYRAYSQPKKNVMPG